MSDGARVGGGGRLARMRGKGKTRGSGGRHGEEEGGTKEDTEKREGHKKTT